MAAGRDDHFASAGRRRMDRRDRPAGVLLPVGQARQSSPQDVDQLSLAAYFTANSPAALAGQAFVQRQYFDKVSETYYYFPGQRRVRRMPAYTHDAPLIGFENQYLIDEANMFNGPIDRFNWKLVGKKDMIVPYNAFGMYTFNAKLRDVATPNGIAAGHRRYEVHRVWVVEATVKPSARHVASKKVFYLDEDSWLALVGEDYDAQGKLWKVRELPDPGVGARRHLRQRAVRAIRPDQRPLRARFVDDRPGQGPSLVREGQRSALQGRFLHGGIAARRQRSLTGAASINNRADVRERAVGIQVWVRWGDESEACR